MQCSYKVTPGSIKHDVDLIWANHALLAPCRALLHHFHSYQDAAADPQSLLWFTQLNIVADSLAIASPYWLAENAGLV